MLYHQRLQRQIDTIHSYYRKAFTFLGEKFLAPAKKLLEEQYNSTHFSLISFSSSSHLRLHI